MYETLEENRIEQIDAIRPRRKAPVIAEMKRRDEAFRERSLERWLDSVPDVHRGFDLRDIKEDRWGGNLTRNEVVNVLRYVNSGGTRFLLLQGPEGVGKSTLGVTMVSELIKRTGAAAKHYVAPVLLSEFSFGGRDNGKDPLTEASRVPILMIDDMGAANGGITEHQQRSLWALIDARWSNRKLRTVITTNMAQNDQRSGAGLKSWLGPTAWARVADDLTQITVRGESFRGQQLDY